MGNFLVFKSTVQDAYRPYCKLSIPHIQRKLITKFYNLQAAGQTNTNTHIDYETGGMSTETKPNSLPGNFGFHIDFPCFHKLFSTLGLEDAITRFKQWDEEEQSGLIDVLELFSLCILFSTATFIEKIKALFGLFDFDDSGGLALSEFTSLIQHVTRAWERALGGTERMKELYQEEMNEAAKRGIMHLTNTHPEAKAQQRGKQSEIRFEQFLIWCGVTGLISSTLGKHFTTDGEEARTYWTALLAGNAQPSSPISIAILNLRNHGEKNRNLNPYEAFNALRDEALRIHSAFKSWIPLHRHILTYRAQHGGGGGSSTSVASSSSAVSSPSAAIPASASAASVPTSSLISPPGSPAPAAPASSVPPSTTSHKPKQLSVDEEDDSPSISPTKLLLQQEVQSKFNSPTAASLARGVRQKYISDSTPAYSSSSQHHSHRPPSSNPVRRQRKLADTLKELELKEHGINGGGRAHEKALANVSSVTSKATSHTGSTIPRDKDDANRHRPAMLAIKRIKAKVQSRRSKDDPHYQHFVYDHNTLRQAKHLFDSIDKDGSGEISIGELSNTLEGNPHLGAAISAFKSLDVDQTGTIEFAELLRALFPLASLHHVKLMSIEVKAIEIDKKDLEILQKTFEWIDEDFDGKVYFKEFLAYLRDPSTDQTGGKRKNYPRDYIPTKAIYELEDERLMTFQEAVYELFAKSHLHMIGEIKRWAANLPVFALTDAQHVELEQLFELYDADGSGSIDMAELVDHFTKLGFTEEDNERMFRMFDRDGGGEIDVVEFKRFYRSVYDSTKAEDYGRGVVTHSQL